MNKTRNIKKFTEKYINFFNSEFGTPESKYRFFDTDSFPNDCRNLGFEMDCGHGFIKAYGMESWCSIEGLEAAIDGVGDVMVIGSGLFSKWRDYNHWSSPSDANDDTKKWFLILLKRMQEINSINE